MKILIAGLGSIGRRHLRNLRALGETDILLYRTHQATLPDEELAGLPVENDLQRALNHRPEAVIVANPTALHLDVAIPAAQAGCSLLMEKPLSHNLERIGELAEALRTSGARALVGFQFRFHPGLRKAAEILASERLGKPVSARARWGEYLPAWHPWEDYRNGYSARADLGGGVVLTLSHPLDYLRWLLGEVEALWAFTGRRGGLGIEVEDTAEIGLRFLSGVLASVHLDYVQRPPRHDLEIVCTGGTLRWDNADGTLRVFEAASGDWQQYTPPEGFERNDLFLEEMRHFLALARGEVEPACTLEDGIQALKLALAALKSASEGRLIEL
jgi:predicted dehydrogenase